MSRGAREGPTGRRAGISLLRRAFLRLRAISLETTTHPIETTASKTHAIDSRGSLANSPKWRTFASRIRPSVIASVP